ncbi:hypothetical protein F4780DRAFT_733724 [Xylariomycetidae sp. FL0641]|nr:hypothetical protein F4780DRAFT_733724 [Xylariomycetidae sp. FL0641]
MLLSNSQAIAILPTLKAFREDNHQCGFTLELDSRGCWYMYTTEKRSTLDTISGSGETALHLAAHKDDVEIDELLLISRASTTIRNAGGLMLGVVVARAQAESRAKDSCLENRVEALAPGPPLLQLLAAMLLNPTHTVAAATNPLSIRVPPGWTLP